MLHSCVVNDSYSHKSKSYLTDNKLAENCLKSFINYTWKVIDQLSHSNVPAFKNSVTKMLSLINNIFFISIPRTLHTGEQ